eukprot:scaffold1221_cov237-Pinguiococcus_pyrenoidosus.AAC.9
MEEKPSEGRTPNARDAEDRKWLTIELVRRVDGRRKIERSRVCCGLEDSLLLGWQCHTHFTAVQTVTRTLSWSPG